MLIKYRIPTKEQFAFIEVEREFVDTVSAETIKETYDTLTAAMKGESGAGLPEKEFCAFLDRYLIEGTGDVDVYNAMSTEQKNIIQCVKRSLKRIKSKSGEPEVDADN